MPAKSTSKSPVKKSAPVQVEVQTKAITNVKTGVAFASGIVLMAAAGILSISLQSRFDTSLRLAKQPTYLKPAYLPGYIPGYTPGYKPGYIPGYTPGYVLPRK